MFLGRINEREECSLVETFPAGLEELHVTHVGEKYDCAATIPALQQVLEQERVLPKLKKLTLEGLFVKHAKRLDEVKRLVQSAKAKGVQTVIVANDSRDHCMWKERTESGWGLDESVQWQECFSNQVGKLTVFDVEGFGW